MGSDRPEFLPRFYCLVVVCGFEHLQMKNRSLRESDQLVMMVNFMCQLAWATKRPDIWSNFCLDVSVKVFLGEINV